MPNSNLDDLLGIVANTGGGYSRGGAKALFFSEHASRAIAEADANNKFFELWDDTNKYGYGLTAEHATLAAALAVEADRKLIWRDDHWMTYGWLHDAIRTAFMETYDPGMTGSYTPVWIQPNSYNMYRPKMSADGEHLWYMNGWATGATLYTHDLSTAWDMETAGSATGTNMTSEGFSNVNSSYMHWIFSPDGTKIYHAANSNFEQATLSTAWDMSTIGTVSQVAVPSGNTMKTFCFNDDGTKVYYYSASLDGFLEAELSTAYDLTTMTQADSTVYLEDWWISDMYHCSWTPDGKYFIVNYSGVFGFEASTPFDLSTLTPVAGNTSLFFAGIGMRPPLNASYSYMFHVDGADRFLIGENSTALGLSLVVDNWDRFMEHGGMGPHGIQPGYPHKVYEGSAAGSSTYQERVTFSTDGLTALMHIRSSTLDGLHRLCRLKIPYILEDWNIVDTYEWERDADCSGARIHPDGKGFDSWVADVWRVYNHRINGEWGDTRSPTATGGEVQYSGSTNNYVVPSSINNSHYFDCWWDEAGEHFYVLARNTSNKIIIYQYDGIGFTITYNSSELRNEVPTSTELGDSYADTATPGGIEFSRDGTRLFLSANGGGYAQRLEFELSVAWDISTMVRKSGGDVESYFDVISSAYNYDKLSRTRNGRWSHLMYNDRVFQHGLPSENL